MCCCSTGDSMTNTLRRQTNTPASLSHVHGLSVQYTGKVTTIVASVYSYLLSDMTAAWGSGLSHCSNYTLKSPFMLRLDSPKTDWHPQHPQLNISTLKVTHLTMRSMNLSPLISNHLYSSNLWHKSSMLIARPLHTSYPIYWLLKNLEGIYLLKQKCYSWQGMDNRP